jgi:putative hydrolase of the HAD superfamily
LKKYHHILFDLDHTLWDFDTNSKETLTEIFNQFQIEKFTGTSVNDFIITYKKINDKLWEDYRLEKIEKDKLRSERFKLTFEKYQLKNNDLAEEVGFYYVNHSPKKTNLIPHSIEILEYLTQKYELHIITNGFEEVQMEKLHHSGLKNYFNHIITSEAANVKKPDVKIFEFALDKIQTNAQQTIMIGDSFEADIIGAMNAGIDQVFFNPNEQLNFSPIPTHIIKKLSEIKNIL